MNIGNKIKRLRTNLDISQRELAEIIGVSVVTIHNWEANIKSPSMEALISLSKTFNISIDRLLNLDKRWDYESEALISTFKKLDRHGKDVVKIIANAELDRMSAVSLPKTNRRSLPLFTSPAAAGLAAPIDYSECETIEVGNDAPSDADYCVIIHGDSMLPYIHNEQIVFVKQTEELSIGDIGIFSVDGSMYCKQMLVRNDGLILVSLNPEYRDTNVMIGRESSSTVKVCGKVLLGYRIPLPGYIR